MLRRTFLGAVAAMALLPQMATQAVASASAFQLGAFQASAFQTTHKPKPPKRT